MLLHCFTCGRDWSHDCVPLTPPLSAEEGIALIEREIEREVARTGALAEDIREAVRDIIARTKTPKPADPYPYCDECGEQESRPCMGVMISYGTDDDGDELRRMAENNGTLMRERDEAQREAIRHQKYRDVAEERANVAERRLDDLTGLLREFLLHWLNTPMTAAPREWLTRTLRLKGFGDVLDPPTTDKENVR